MRNHLIVALLLAAPTVLSAQADTSRLPLDTAIHTGRLPNGLRYYVRRNAKPEHRAELRLVVNAGSILEEENQRGLAHFVEHMAFNGTRHFAKSQLVDAVERMGMRFGPHLNAYTSFDETVYMLQVPTDSARLVETAFTILEDWAGGLAFDTTEVRKERGVVIEEWRLGLGAENRMQKRELPVIFRGSRYAQRMPIGDEQTLRTFDVATLKKFYSDWYRPDLMAVIAVGDFDAAAIERKIRQHFGGLRNPPKERPRTMYPVPDHDSTLTVVSSDKEATQSLAITYYMRPVSEKGTARAYRQGIVENLYDGMLNARLREIARRSDAPFLAAFAGEGQLVRTKDVYQVGVLVAENGIAKGLEAALTESERVDKLGFTPTELERAKADMLRGMEQAYAERGKTNSNAFADEYARHFLTGEPAPGIAREYEMTKQWLPGITLAEVNKLATESISDRNCVIVARVPEKDGVSKPSESELTAVFARVKDAQVTAYVDSTSDKPLFAARPAGARIVAEKRDTVLGTQEWTFENGIRVIAKPTDFKNDELIFSSFSPGGLSLGAPQDWMSIVQASGLVAAQGVGPFSTTELGKKLAGKAVGVSPYIARYYEGVSGGTSPKDLETALQLANLYITSPRRDSVAIAALKTRAKASIANRNASPNAAFSDTLEAIMSNHDPRVRPLTPALIDSISGDVALRFYRERFADVGDLVFVFVGSMNVDTLKSLTASYLGTLPSQRRKEAWRDLGFTSPTGVIQRDVKRGIEPKSQTQLVFTGPLQYTVPNWYSLVALGQVLSIKLREQLREELGGTYSVNANGGASRIPKPEYQFTVSFGSAPARADELLKAVWTQIDSLKKFGADTATLSKVREAARRTRETALKQNNYWLGQLIEREQVGIDPSLILSNQSLLQMLTPEFIKDAANRFLKSDNYVLVRLLPEADPPKP